MARLKGIKSKTKAKRARNEVRTLVPTRIDEKSRHRQRSMHLNNIFDNFRREIEECNESVVLHVGLAFSNGVWDA
jgi:hypothetical protein